RPMPPARRAFVQNALAPQRDDGNEQHDEVKRRIVRLQLHEVAAELATVLPRDKIVFAVIPGPDAVDGGGHAFMVFVGATPASPSVRWRKGDAGVAPT